VETATEGPKALEQSASVSSTCTWWTSAMPDHEWAGARRRDPLLPSVREGVVHHQHSDRLFQDRILLKESEAFLEKPFTPEDLRAAVSLLLLGHLRGPRG
jgi:hypothetical protein